MPFIMQRKTKNTQIRSFLLKLRRAAPPLELGNMLATGLRKKADGRDNTWNDQYDMLNNGKLQHLNRKTG